MSTKERWFLKITLFIISFLTLFDLISDLKDGVTWWHVSVEAIVVLAAGFGFLYLLHGTFSLRHSLENEKLLSSKLRLEKDKYKEQSKSFIEGLSQTIDEQLSQWKLSKSEKEVAFLILKGFSLKEVAQLRGTTEKTARTQSASIYNKAALANRSQLSAFFLEDLLVPNVQRPADLRNAKSAGTD